MKKNNVRITLIALEDDDSKFYQDILASHDYIMLEAYSTIQQFKRACLGKQYSGFIVDMRTLIRSSTQEKEFFATLHEGYPVMQVRRSPDDTSINCLVRGKQLGDLRGEQLLDSFITNDCWKMTPRQVRLLPRKNIYLNTQMYFTEKGKPLKTNLWNISEGGCFVLTTQKVKKGEPVWLTINELSDKNRIRSEVKWSKSWGTAPNHLPGLGLSFEGITEGQRSEIQKTIEN